MVPNSPHMAWVDPGEGKFTCQVNRSTMVSIELGPPRRESRTTTTTPLRLFVIRSICKSWNYTESNESNDQTESNVT